MSTGNVMLLTAAQRVEAIRKVQEYAAGNGQIISDEDAADLIEDASLEQGKTVASIIREMQGITNHYIPESIKKVLRNRGKLRGGRTHRRSHRGGRTHRRSHRKSGKSHRRGRKTRRH